MSGEKDINGIFSQAAAYFVVPRVVSERLSAASEAEVKVAVYMCANPSATPDEAARALSVDKAKVDSALAFWRGAGAVSAEPEAGTYIPQRRLMGDPPAYSGSQLADIVKSSKTLPSVLNECQRLLQKTFTSHDTEIYIGCLYDFLGLSPEYILMLTSYCCQMGKKNVRYIEKTAFSLTEQGIDDCEKLECYISDSEKKAKAEYKLRKLFGFGDRALTAAEKKHFDRFSSYPMDMVKYAYGQMINNIGKVKLAYIAKIMDSWDEKGIKTLARAESEAEKRASTVRSSVGSDKKKGVAYESDSYNFDEFLSAAIKNGTKKK